MRKDVVGLVAEVTVEKLTVWANGYNYVCCPKEVCLVNSAKESSLLDCFTVSDWIFVDVVPKSTEQKQLYLQEWTATAFAPLLNTEDVPFTVHRNRYFAVLPTIF